MVWQGKKPSGIAGCILYKASQDSNSPRTQSEVCKVSGISEVTLRGLLKILNQILDPTVDPILNSIFVPILDSILHCRPKAD